MRPTFDPPGDALRASGRAQTALPGAMSAHVVDRVFEELQGGSYDLPVNEEHRRYFGDQLASNDEPAHRLGNTEDRIS